MPTWPIGKKKDKKKEKEEEEERQRQVEHLQIEEKHRQQRQREEEERWRREQGHSETEVPAQPLIDHTPPTSHLDDLVGSINAHSQTTVPHSRHGEPPDGNQPRSTGASNSDWPNDTNGARQPDNMARTPAGGASADDFNSPRPLSNGSTNDELPSPLMDRLRDGVSRNLRIHMPELLNDQSSRVNKKRGDASGATGHSTIIESICKVIMEEVKAVNMDEASRLQFKNKNLNHNLKSLTDEMGIKEASISDMRHKISGLEKQVSIAEQKLRDQRTKHETEGLKWQNQSYNRSEQVIADLNRQLREKDEAFEEAVNERNQAIKIRDGEIATKVSEITNLKQQFDADGYHLTRIRGERQALKDELAGLKEQTGAHSSTLASLRSKHSKDTQDLIEQHEAALEAKGRELLEDFNNQAREKFNKQREEFEKLQKAFQGLNSKHEREKDELEDEHIKVINRTISEHSRTIESMQDEHKSALQKHREQDQIAREQLALQHEQEEEANLLAHKEAENDLLTRIKTLKKEAADEKAKLDGALESQRKQHQNEKHQLEDEYEAEVKKLKTDIALLQDKMMDAERKHKDEIAEIERKHKDVMTSQKKKHQDDLLSREQRLRADVNDLSQALMTRDSYILPTLEIEDVKQSNDEYLKSRYMELVQFVDDMGRLGWKSSQQVWSDKALQALVGPSHTDRLLKKHILQDDIWNLLHEFVFCSPFRVFGEEGEDLEKEWNEQCGKSKDPEMNNGLYTWPDLAAETERWRYATVGECRAALTKPVPSKWDPRAKLKQAFRAHLEDMREEFTTRIGGIIEWDDNSTKAMERLTLKAMNTWLDFAMQRCRVVVLLEGSRLISPAKKAQTALQGSLHLDIVPSLGRYGNSLGADLDAFDVIGGCNGENVKLP